MAVSDRIWPISLMWRYHRFFLRQPLRPIHHKIFGLDSNTSKLSKRGFTLVELLIVISLIGILAVGSAGAYLNTQKKARDARRKTDLETLRQAFELYKATNSEYPPYTPPAAGNSEGSTDNNTFKNRITGSGDGGPFVNPASYPADPKSAQNYFYNRNSGTTYIVCARLESPDAGSTCPGGGNCGTGANSCNYGLIQP